MRERQNQEWKLIEKCQGRTRESKWRPREWRVWVFEEERKFSIFTKLPDLLTDEITNDCHHSIFVRLRQIFFLAESTHSRVDLKFHIIFIFHPFVMTSTREVKQLTHSKISWNWNFRFSTKYRVTGQRRESWTTIEIRRLSWVRAFPFSGKFNSNPRQIYLADDDDMGSTFTCYRIAWIWLRRSRTLI